MRRWPEVRAGLIAIAIGFGLIDGCPLPPPKETPAWEQWFVDPLRQLRHAALWPVGWLGSLARVDQRWALFQAANSERFRMSIEGERADGAWQILYRAADDAHAEHAELLEYRRIRGTWDPTAYLPGSYTAFASWITARVLAEHPELVAARVRMEQIHIVPGGFEPSGRYISSYQRSRR